ncbi:MAG: ABC transporter permease [Planctomycetota bacterium]|nr:ABC transporter permease [Planctomycetota bacterium]
MKTLLAESPGAASAALSQSRPGLLADLRVLSSFFCRQMAMFLSNRTETLFALASMSCWAIAYGVMGKFFTKYADPKIKDYLQGCPDYTSFLVIGFLVSLLVFSARGNVTWLVRSKDFPNLYTAPCSLPIIILGANMWKYCWIFLQVVLFMVVAYFLFGVTFHVNAGFFAVVGAGIILMTAFDLIGAGFRVITKGETDPINWTIGISGMVLSGQLFPIQALPPWAQPLCYLHPQYYINTLARRTMGEGLGITAVWRELGGFALTSLLLLVIGYWIFRLGFRRARVEGTLGYE